MTTTAILATIDSKKGAILSIIPRTFRAALTWESIRNGIGLAVSRSEKLRQCDPLTVYQSVLDILRFGLDPSGVTGQAFLVPYYNKDRKRYECSPIIGQQGKIEMAWRTGLYASIVTEVVHENDSYSFDLARRQLTHTYDPNEARGEPLFAYCRIWLKGFDLDGPPNFQEIMGRPDFEKIAQGKRSPAYRLWFDEMFRRSALARCLKRAPKSVDLAEVLNREAELVGQVAQGSLIDFADGHTDDPPAEAPKKKPAKKPAAPKKPAPKTLPEVLDAEPEPEAEKVETDASGQSSMPGMP